MEERIRVSGVLLEAELLELAQEILVARRLDDFAQLPRREFGRVVWGCEAVGLKGR